MSAPLDRPPLNSYRTGPDERGHFGIYGGRYVAETLMPLILDLERAYTRRQGRSRRSRPSLTICLRIMAEGQARSISPSA